MMIPTQVDLAKHRQVEILAEAERRRRSARIRPADRQALPSRFVSRFLRER